MFTCITNWEERATKILGTESVHHHIPVTTEMLLQGNEWRNQQMQLTDQGVALVQ